MTTHSVFPTPLPADSPDPLPDAEPEPEPEPEPAGRPLTIQDVYGLLNEHRAAVHEALQELRVSGAAVNVPFDAVFLCELAGLVVDLQSGAILGVAEGRAPAPVPGLRRRLAGGGIAVDGTAAA